MVSPQTTMVKEEVVKINSLLEKHGENILGDNLNPETEYFLDKPRINYNPNDALSRIPNIDELMADSVAIMGALKKHGEENWLERTDEKYRDMTQDLLDRDNTAFFRLDHYRAGVQAMQSTMEYEDFTSAIPEKYGPSDVMTNRSAAEESLISLLEYATEN